MRDRQVKLPGGQGSIPFVSPFLHCVAMTVLVYLRTAFGFVYLRPKSVFIAFSWAFVLFTIYAWNEPEVWQEYHRVCVFGISSVALYAVHLTGAFLRELKRTGEHDRFSGRSHTFTLLRSLGRGMSPRLEMVQHLWVEPAAVLFAALAVRVVYGERHLSLWLCFAAICLWFKEALNYWQDLRQDKRREDIFAETEESVESTSPNTPNFEPPKAARQARIKRQRNAAEDPAIERRFAELLRLLPPYTIAQAEEHYRALIKEEHPDTHSTDTGSTPRTVELNAAVEYFRKTLSQIDNHSSR